MKKKTLRHASAVIFWKVASMSFLPLAKKNDKPLNTFEQTTQNSATKKFCNCGTTTNLSSTPNGATQVTLSWSSVQVLLAILMVAIPVTMVPSAAVYGNSITIPYNGGGTYRVTAI